MKNVRKILSISAVLVMVMLAGACSNFFGPAKGGTSASKSAVTIRIAGPDARTILPDDPVFCDFALMLQKAGQDPVVVEDTGGIDGEGVTVDLTAGTWTITLSAYQDILANGDPVLAAQGSAVITVTVGETSKTVLINLTPIAIDDPSCEQGVFSYAVILPAGVQEAVLSIEGEEGFTAEINLLEGNSGSLTLNPGYYGMSVVLDKNGQSAGLFEAVHIYSGLVSSANLDLTDIVFVDKVYIAGTLGGIRLGNIKISDDANGENILKEIALNSATARRSRDWVIDLPAANIGKVLYAVQEFNGEYAIAPIGGLESNGKSDVALELIPGPVALVNVAPWYSTVSGGINPELAVDGNVATYRGASSGELILDYGFNVTVNSCQIIFYSESGTVDLDGYLVEYWDGAEWQTLVQLAQSFSGSTDGSVTYSSFFPEVSASKFRWSGAGGDDAAIIEFGLYKAADRTSLGSAIAAARENCDAAVVSADGGDVDLFETWVTADVKAAYQAAIDEATAACNDPCLAAAELADAEEALAAATAEFNAAKTVVALGVPVLSLAPGYSYSTITAQWTEARLADAYRIEYKYATDANWTTAATVDGNTFACTFKPNGYNEIAQSGKELQVRVIALNTVFNAEAVSNIETKRLVGPAEMGVTATQAVSADYIDISWNAVPGAEGYYVARRQFTMNNADQVDVTAPFYVEGAAWRDACQPDDDMAWGYPYRYIVIPVISQSDTPAVNYTDGSYTLADVTYTGTAAIEQTGFTFGYGWNVTASKGTYSSSGNVNDGIQVIWDALPLRAGVTFTVYRNVAGESNWQVVAVTGNTSHVEAPSRGVVYEYAVGISLGSAPASLPHTSERFMTSPAMAQVDSRGRLNRQGFMQSLIKMQHVTRGEDADLNAIYGERVTWETPTGYDWGIDGYTVYVMNRNINANWHVIGDNIAATNDGSGLQSTVFTATITATAYTGLPNITGNTGSVAISDSYGSTTRNMLFVLRDYKHFFKARSYIMHNGTKIYSPDPPWTYEYKWATNQAAHIDQSNAMQNDYVKWGSRQITKDEFIKIASLYFARGQDRAIGTGSWPIADRTGDASTNMGGSGRMVANYTYNWIPSFTYWYYNFTNYKDDLQARCGQWMTFVTINGRLYSRNGAVNTRPQRYYENGNGFMDVSGPWDTPHLYTGKIRFGHGSDDASTNLKWGSGTITVEYPLGTGQQEIPFRGQDTPMDFTNQSSNGRLNGNAWR